MALGSGSELTRPPRKQLWRTIALLSGCADPRPCSISHRNWRLRLSRCGG
ncbi:hypothetical protein LINPERHAP2_LOCUS26558 [Linum perenne]